MKTSDDSQLRAAHPAVRSRRRDAGARHQPHHRRRKDRRNRPMVRKPRDEARHHPRVAGVANRSRRRNACWSRLLHAARVRRRRRRDGRRVHDQPPRNGFFIFNKGEGYEYVMTLVLIGVALARRSAPASGRSTKRARRGAGLPRSNSVCSSAVLGGLGAARAREEAVTGADFWRPERKPRGLTRAAEFLRGVGHQELGFERAVLDRSHHDLRQLHVRRKLVEKYDRRSRRRPRSGPASGSARRRASACRRARS